MSHVLPRIFLSPPHMGNDELNFVVDAFKSNYIAPVGPHVDAFEAEFKDLVSMPHAVAVSSGTAALHLALRLLDLQPGDEVLCSSLTFIASATPIVYERAVPVFIDADRATWNIDPYLLSEELKACAKRGKLPRAVIAVDLYGQAADYDPILTVCNQYGVPVIEDAAEALGATYQGKSAGSFGKCGVFSFNGNKIITTSGGGMLVSHDGELIERARFLATQARDPAPHYQHSMIGYNYRLSNILAAIGRGQLRVVPDRVKAHTRNYCTYRERLMTVPGIEFMPVAPYGIPNHWLTCIQIEPSVFGASREDVRLALEEENIESRPVWKPLHIQPVFADCRVRGGAVAEELFEKGLCLPSGSALTDDNLHRICDVLLAVPHSVNGKLGLLSD